MKKKNATAKIEEVLKSERIRMPGGNGATLQAVKYSDGEYDCILMEDGDSKVQNSIQKGYIETPEECLELLDSEKDWLDCPEPTGKYKKISDDLRDAVSFAIKTARKYDYGTCTNETLEKSEYDVDEDQEIRALAAIYLPGMDEDLLRNAMREAGTDLNHYVLDKWATFSEIVMCYTNDLAVALACGFMAARGYKVNMVRSGTYYEKG